jgi:hypothetical protein
LLTGEGYVAGGQHLGEGWERADHAGAWRSSRLTFPVTSAYLSNMRNAR